jgi:dTDP-L-rhamnose 4-epimerase
MKKILITGGAGFIGSNLALSLRQKGFEVTVLDNLSKQIHGEEPIRTSPLYNSIKDKVHFIKGSITSKSDWLKAIAENEIIVHLAAETGTGQSMYQISHYVDTNIGGTAIMLDILANNKTQVQKVVLSSSRAVYGEGKYLSPGLQPVFPVQRKTEDMDEGRFEVTFPGINEPLQLTATDEESKIHPSSVYGITKQNQEQMVTVVCNAVHIAPVVLRYQNVYGPGQSLSNPYTGILSIFSTLIKNRKPINIFEDGNESRDFVYIDDVVRATALAIEKTEANGQVFNVGAGVPVSVMDVAVLLMKNYGIEVPLQVTGNYRVGDIRHSFADISKINELLGFKPSVTFEVGIKRFIGWVNSQEVGTSRYDESIAELKDKGLMK